MSGVLLAVGDRDLRDACRGVLSGAGHSAFALERPLAALTLAPKLRWDLACVDASPLGREALALLTDGDVLPAPVLGLGLEDGRLAANLALPLTAEAFAARIEALLAPSPPDEAPSVLRLDALRRSAVAYGNEVTLTRTEFRLLSFLLQHQPRELSLAELLAGVWGFAEGGRSASVLVRAHVRNLRLKLARIGLGDAVRSRRGRGYALVV